MAFLVFLVVINVLIFRTAGAGQDGDVPSFVGEVQRRDETRTSSDTTSLLNKLIIDLEGMKGQILSEMPEQLEKQVEEMKKMADDIKGTKELIAAQAKQTDSSIAKLSEDIGGVRDCCSKQEERTKNSQKHLEKIETSFDHATRKISESLASHDQRLQNLSSEGFCKKLDSSIPKDCSEIKRMGSTSSSAYRISLNNNVIDVYCDFDTPGGDWLVFQRRKDGSVDFYRNWASYTKGFGRTTGEFWLGNEILHQLTSNRRYKLRVDLEDFQNKKSFAEYSSFSVGPSSDYYRMKIGSYSGNAGDSLTYHNNQQFSTYDVDRDTGADYNCAESFRGGWWYQYCHYSNLNGKFYRGNHSSYADGVNWYHFHGHHYSLKSEMKIALLN